jgi:peroxiredoxin
MIDSTVTSRRGNMTEPVSREVTDLLLPLAAPAPDFTLAATPDQSLTLSDLAGQPGFYPADWSPVCGDQMALYNEVLPTFRDYGAELLGISVDSAWCHPAFAQSRNLEFPLLADFEPKGAVAKAYRAYREEDGFAQRAALCHRQGRYDLLELSLPRGGQSRG